MTDYSELEKRLRAEADAVFVIPDEVVLNASVTMREAADAISCLTRNVAAFDANVERLKACEMIADGDDGWEAVRDICPSAMSVSSLRDCVEDLERDLEDARQGPWPEWAEKLLRLLELWGAEYEADDEIDLPDELAEWLHHYASDIKQTAERRRLSRADGDKGSEGQ